MSYTNDKTNTNERPRKRDIFMNRVDRAASKLGLSSQSHAGHPYLQEAMTTTLPGSMSMTPSFSEGYKMAHHPAPPLHKANNPNETHSKAPPDNRITGSKKPSVQDRLDQTEEKKKKKEEEKKRKEEEKKRKKLEENKTGS